MTTKDKQKTGTGTERYMDETRIAKVLIEDDEIALAQSCLVEAAKILYSLDKDAEWMYLED